MFYIFIFYLHSVEEKRWNNRVGEYRTNSLMGYSDAETGFILAY